MSTFNQTIEAFLKDSGMKPTRFGIEAMGDPRFVFRIREGSDVRMKTVARVEQFIADYWQQQEVA